MRGRPLTTLIAAAATLALVASIPPAQAKPADLGYTRYFAGNPADAKGPLPGRQLLSGGGVDDPTAMTWLMGRDAGKADVVVLDAYGPDIYTQPFLSWGADSVETFVFSSRDGATSPAVLDSIAKAEVIWLDGGDQSNYVTYWGGTPLVAAVNARVKQGASFGGMSAGLAVQGGWVYTAMNGSATSTKVLENPYDKDVTLGPALFDLPCMANTITDTHFRERDRMGRLLGFLGRLETDKDFRAVQPRAIAVDADSSLGVDSATGEMQLFGTGAGAWLLSTSGVTARTVLPKTPLTYGPVTVQRMSAGDTFNLKSWTGTGTDTYSLSAVNGVLSLADPY